MARPYESVTLSELLRLRERAMRLGMAALLIRVDHELRERGLWKIQSTTK